MANWADIYADCIYHLKMNDDAASTVVIDSKLLSNGTSIRNTSLMHVDGKVSGALDFNGVSDYVIIPSFVVEEVQTVLNDSFTISMLVKPDDGQPDISNCLWGLGNHPQANTIHFGLTVEGKVFFGYDDNAMQSLNLLSSVLFSDGAQTQWNMITLVVEKTGLNTVTAYLYFNGILDTLTPDGTNMSSFIASSDSWIGRGTVSSVLYYFSGLIDDVMIFNRALTAAEVLFLYENIERPIINTVVDGGDEDSVVINLTSAGNSQLYYREKFATSWTTGLTDDSEGTIIQTGLTAGKWYEFYVIDDETNRPSNIVECEVVIDTILIESAIYSLLKNDGTINGLVGTKIYPNLVPQSIAMPAITYQEISSPREYTASGATGTTEARFQINCWDDNYSGAKEVAEAVRKKLSGYKGTVGILKIQSCFLVDEDDMPQASPETDVLKRYGKRLDFILMYDESLV